MSKQNEVAYKRQCRPSLPKAVPQTVVEAQTAVLDAATQVEHAYSAGGGWSVPLSLTLRHLVAAVKHLRALEHGVDHEEGYPPRKQA